MANPDEPVELNPTVICGLTGSGHVDIKIGWQQFPYDIFPSNDGSQMLLLGMNFLEIYYLQSTCPDKPWMEGRIFRQTKLGYIGAVNQGATGREVYLRTKATKSVLSDFLDVYLGCMAVAGGPLAYLISGMGLAVSFGKLKQEIPIYCEALEAFVSNDFELRRAMPTFYDMMYIELFLSRIEADAKSKAKDLLKDSIPANKAVKGLIGVFLGKVGEDPMKKLLGGIRDIIRGVLLKTIDRVSETATALTQVREF